MTKKSEKKKRRRRTKRRRKEENAWWRKEAVSEKQSELPGIYIYHQIKQGLRGRVSWLLRHQASIPLVVLERGVMEPDSESLIYNFELLL